MCQRRDIRAFVNTLSLRRNEQWSQERIESPRNGEIRRGYHGGSCVITSTSILLGPIWLRDTSGACFLYDRKILRAVRTSCFVELTAWLVVGGAP